MSKTIKYIGTQNRWPELAVTGKQSTWSPGWMDERSDSEAAQLLATGLFFDVDSINQTPAESAALSGLVSRGGNIVERVTMAGGGASSGAWSSSSAVGKTWQHQIGLRSKPFAVRVTYDNPTLTAYTVDKTTAYCSATYPSAGGDPTGGAYTNILFAGAASIALPAASDANSHAFVQSDWTIVNPIARTDVVGSPYLMYIKSYIANGGATAYPYRTNTNHSGYPSNTTSGLVRVGGFGAGDTSASAMSSWANPSLYLPMTLEVRSLSRIVRVLSLGDSVIQGPNNASGGILASMVERAVTLLNAQSSNRMHCHQNFGWAGQYSLEMYPRITNILAKFPADVVVLSAWSPNDAAATDSASANSMARMLRVVDEVRAAGAYPVLLLGTPKDAFSAAQDTQRLATNAAITAMGAAFGIQVVDIASPISVVGAPMTWSASYSADGLHPNDAATDLMAALIAPAIKAAF